MDYEQYYADSQAFTRELKEKTAAQTKAVNKIQKCIEDGDIGALPKLFAALREASKAREEALERLESMTAGFDGREYMSSGDYSTHMIECCRELGIDVRGSFPVYEMFPCSVTVNPETQDVTVDRKRFPFLRPSRLVSDIKKELDTLSKAAFNTQQFAKELAAAYDLAIIKASKKKACAADAPMYALDLYEVLTPMKRHKKEYTKRAFAFDIARLYSGGDAHVLDDGRILRFDTVRDAKKSIRILDKYGTEQFVTTIRFSK